MVQAPRYTPWLAYVLAAVLLLWIRSAELPFLNFGDRWVLSDPDSYVRALMVEHALAGGDLTPRRLYEYNAPEGMPIAWTSPMTLIGSLLALPWKCVGQSCESAARMAALLTGPSVGLLSLAVMGWLAFRIGGPWISIAVLLVWPFLEDVIAVTRFGNADHHSLHQLLFALMMGGCVAWRKRPTEIGGVLIGAACAFGLWSAPFELLPAYVLVAGLAVWESARGQDDATRRFWRAWWISALFLIAAAWLFEFWPNLFHRHLSYLSVWHVALVAITGALVEHLGRQKRSQAQLTISVCVAIALAGLSALAVGGFDLRRLFAVQDPEVMRQLIVTREFEPYWRGGLGTVLVNSWWKYGLLPVLTLSMLAQWRRLERREIWLFLITLVYSAVTITQIRWADFLAPAFILTAVLGAGVVMRRRPFAVLAVLLAAAPPIYYALHIQSNARRSGLPADRGPFAEMAALESAAACVGRVDNPPVLLAPWDQGSVLGASGKVRVIGAAFWTNVDGLHDTHDLYTTRNWAHFQALLKKRNVEYVLVTGPERTAIAISQGYFVLHGIPPTKEEVVGSCLWQLASRAAPDLAVDCPALEQLQPAWRILRTEPVRREGAPVN